MGIFQPTSHRWRHLKSHAKCHGSVSWSFVMWYYNTSLSRSPEFQLQRCEPTRQNNHVFSGLSREHFINMIITPSGCWYVVHAQWPPYPELPGFPGWMQLASGFTLKHPHRGSVIICESSFRTSTFKCLLPHLMQCSRQISSVAKLCRWCQTAYTCIYIRIYIFVSLNFRNTPTGYYHPVKLYCIITGLST